VIEGKLIYLGDAAVEAHVDPLMADKG